MSEQSSERAVRTWMEWGREKGAAAGNDSKPQARWHLVERAKTENYQPNPDRDVIAHILNAVQRLS